MQITLEDATLVEAGVDWLTLTAQHETKEAEWMETTARHWFLRAQLAGEEPKLVPLPSYEAWGVKGLTYGKRPDGVLLQGTSAGANALMEEVRATTLEFHCSRIDLQGTFKVPEDQPDLPATLRHFLREQPKDAPPRRRRNCNLRERDRTGNSVDINSRTSELFFRFYDKWRESEGVYPFPCWRAETECKGKQAQGHFNNAMKCNSLPHLSGAVLWDTWGSVGFDLAPILVMESYEKFSTYEKRSEDRTLKWFRSHVRGSVKKSIDAGHLEEVIDALGLTAYVLPEIAARIEAKELSRLDQMLAAAPVNTA